MKTLLCATASFLLFNIFSFAQKEKKINTGDVKAKDFEIAKLITDTSAKAVYLFDIGSSKFEGNNSGSFSVVYKEQKRIHILNKSCIDDVGTVEIRYYSTAAFESIFDKFHASVYTLVNGEVQETKVRRDNIFKERDGDYFRFKFSFPNLSEGCIIDYGFEITHNDYEYVRPWIFEGTYPKVWSEYTFECPDIFEFAVLKQGVIPNIKQTIKRTSKTYNLSNAAISRSNFSTLSSTSSISVTEYKWVAENILPLKQEPFISTLKNYVSRIDFLFYSLRHIGQSPEIKMTSWSQLTKMLLSDKEFGGNLELDNEDLDALLDNFKKECSSKEELAKKIFYYVEDNFSNIKDNSIYLTQNLQTTLLHKQGNVADINMLLMTMLNKAGLDAKPIILSTIENGHTSLNYPILNQYNYVAVYLIIDETEYTLDAADGVVGFGRLPDKCYNDNGRIITEPPMIYYFSPDEQIEKKRTIVDIKNSNGKMEGVFKSLLGFSESGIIRRKLKTENKESLISDLKKHYELDISIEKINIDSLNKKDFPITLQYNYNFNLDNSDVVYFDPLQALDYKYNPFAASERFCPVELPYCIDEAFEFRMEVPEGYIIEEMPASSYISFKDSVGTFQYNTKVEGKYFTAYFSLIFTKAIVEAKDYKLLRSFYEQITKKRAEQIVFKKIK